MVAELQFAARRVPRIVQRVINPALSLLILGAPGGDLNRLYSQSADASSYLQNNWNRFSENYHPNYVLDDNPKTAWVEGADDDGLGESLTIEVSSVASARSVKLSFRNGYQKSKKLFTANATPKDIEVELLGVDRQTRHRETVQLKRSWGWQDILLKPAAKKGFSAVRITVRTVYPGRVYKDTCLSDVRVFVDSDTKYNKAAEHAKRDALKAWIKQRVADAKYFAKLPKSYPFAATHYERDTDERQVVWQNKPDHVKHGTDAKGKLVALPKQVSTGNHDATFVARVDDEGRAAFARLFALAKDRGASSGMRLYTSMVKDRVRLPDGFWLHPDMFVDYLDRSRISFFETDKTRYDHLAKLKRARNKDAPFSYILEVTSKWIRGYPRITWNKDAEGKRKLGTVYVWAHHVTQERSVYDTMKHCLIAFDEAERIDRLTCSNEDVDGLNLGHHRFSYDDGGKIREVHSVGATYVGAQSPESEGEHNAFTGWTIKPKAAAIAKK